MGRTIQPAGRALVQGGLTQFGTFDGPFEQVNPLDARLLGAFPIPRGVKALRLKEWHAFQLDSERYFVCVALFNAKTLALAQIKIYDKQTERKTLIEKKLAPWSLRIASGLQDSSSSYAGGGVRIEIRNALARGQFEVNFDVRADERRPAVSGAVTVNAAGASPQVVSIPFGRNHGMYSHKCLMPASGSLSIDGVDVRLSPDRAFVFMDDHKGFYPVAMIWDWLTCGARLSDGTLVGFNLTHNQSIDDERFNENCLWMNGELHLLPPVRFHRETTSGIEQWSVRDAGGVVDVRFDVEMPSRIDINALVLRSKYSGPYGRAHGHIDLPSGRLPVNDWFGMGEDFYLRC